MLKLWIQSRIDLTHIIYPRSYLKTAQQQQAHPAFHQTSKGLDSSTDRSSREGGDDGHYPATYIPLLMTMTKPWIRGQILFQEGGDDGRGPGTNPLKGHQNVKLRQPLELRSKRGQEDTFYMS